MKRNSKKRMTGQSSIRKVRKRKLLKKPTRRLVPKRKRSLTRVLMPIVHPVGAIIIASNAEPTIEKVLEQLKRLPLREIVVLIHGSKDRTLEMVRSHSSAIIVHDPEPLEQDVARTLAAKISQSDLLLFIEGDQFVSAEALIPFVQDTQQGLENGTLARRHELAAYEHNYSNV